MISIIAAIGKNNELGKDNKLLWDLPEDLKYFKEKTSGKMIVMGKNTFDSLPKTLPNRHHLVLCLENFSTPESVTVVDSKAKALEIINSQTEEVFIIGGGQIYNLFLENTTKLYLTEINKEYDADTYFPLIDKSKFKEISRIKGSNEELDYDFVVYEKI